MPAERARKMSIPLGLMLGSRWCVEHPVGTLAAPTILGAFPDFTISGIELDFLAASLPLRFARVEARRRQP
jgi:hypothetical protein